MSDAFVIQHVNVNVDDLAAATRFYTEVLGLEPVTPPEQGFPSQFFQLGGGQQIHMNEIGDLKAYRAHFCMVAQDFMAVFQRAKAAGAIDLQVWGKVRRLRSGNMQMFLRDPSGNLIEISSRPGVVLPASLFDDEIVEPEPGIYAVMPGTKLGGWPT